MKLSEDNGLVYGSNFFNLTLAWLHLEAFDFEPAFGFAHLGLEQARQTPFENFPTFLGLILLGRACLGVGKFGRVGEYLDEIRSPAEANPWGLDWLLKMPLYQLQAEYWQSLGDSSRAAEAACRLCDLAAAPGERTFLPQGYRLLAEVALTRKGIALVQVHLTRALAALDESEAPLATWRVHTVAAEFYNLVGRPDDATMSRTRSAEVIRSLADSLEEDDPLRRSFLASAPARGLREKPQCRFRAH